MEAFLLNYRDEIKEMMRNLFGMNGLGKVDFESQYKQKKERIEQLILSYLPEETDYQKTVLSAMNYSVQVGGKRLRPMLMAEVCELVGEHSKLMEPFMAAIEMIHTYSLVHDDLPAMDNDEYRRGKKTTHVVYGEGMAILAGDGLLNYAFETASKAFDLADSKSDYEKVAYALQILAKKAGIYGMIGGQTADLEAEAQGDAVTKEQLMFIHKNKTAALIEAAMMIGAIFGGADQGKIEQIETCAYNIGIAFQIQDDILDITGSLETLGKPIGSDAKNEKLTYVTLHGMEESKVQVETLSREAIEILRSFETTNEFLEALIEQLIYRDK